MSHNRERGKVIAFPSCLTCVNDIVCSPSFDRCACHINLDVSGLKWIGTAVSKNCMSAYTQWPSVGWTKKGTLRNISHQSSQNFYQTHSTRHSLGSEWRMGNLKIYLRPFVYYVSYHFYSNKKILSCRATRKKTGWKVCLWHVFRFRGQLHFETIMQMFNNKVAFTRWKKLNV